MNKTSRILRLPINVRIFNEKGEMVQSINSSKKTQIISRLRGVPRAEWISGTVRVWYNKPDDFWNEAEFRTASQLQDFLTTATEKPLIDFLKPIIPPNYLEKRKMTARQRASIAKAIKNSPLKLGKGKLL